MECFVCTRLSQTPLCSSCQRDVDALSFRSLWHERCPLCGSPILSNAYPCTFCAQGYRAYGPLQGLLAELMHRYKDEKEKGISRLFASLLVPLVPQTKGTVLVPIPASLAGRKQRGFDQGVLIARQMGLPVKDLLERKGKGPFQVKRKKLDELERIIVIDDVIYSGTTMHFAISALQAVYPVPIQGLAVCLAGSGLA